MPGSLCFLLRLWDAGQLFFWIAQWNPQLIATGMPAGLQQGCKRSNCQTTSAHGSIGSIELKLLSELIWHTVYHVDEWGFRKSFVCDVMPRYPSGRRVFGQDSILATQDWLNMFGRHLRRWHSEHTGISQCYRMLPVQSVLFTITGAFSCGVCLSLNTWKTILAAHHQLILSPPFVNDLSFYSQILLQLVTSARGCDWSGRRRTRRRSPVRVLICKFAPRLRLRKNQSSPETSMQFCLCHKKLRHYNIVDPRWEQIIREWWQQFQDVPRCSKH